MTDAIAVAKYTAPQGTGIGHVHLRVSDLDRSIAFYCGVLGFQLQARIGGDAAFLGAPMPNNDGTIYHHHIGLNTWQSRGGVAPAKGHTGLYHAAILYPDRLALSQAVRQVLNAGIALTGATDHGISEAVYLDDPDNNGLELYRDRTPAEWERRADGSLVMSLQPLDINALLSETS